MTINEKFTEILGVVGYTVNDDDIVVNSNGDTINSTTDKPFCLPTVSKIKEYRVLDPKKNMFKNIYDIFNPFDEGGIKGTTETLHMLRRGVTERLNKLFTEAVVALLNISISGNYSEGSVELNKLLSELTKTDHKTVTAVNTLFKYVPSMLGTFVKNKGVVDGIKYTKVTVLHCDFYKRLVIASGSKELTDKLNEELRIEFDRKFSLRVTDVDNIKAVMKYLLFGSDSVAVGDKSTPYPTANTLLGLFDKVVSLWKPFITEQDLFSVDGSTIDDLYGKELLHIPRPSVSSSRGVVKPEPIELSHKSVMYEAPKRRYEPLTDNVGVPPASRVPPRSDGIIAEPRTVSNSRPTVEPSRSNLTPLELLGMGMSSNPDTPNRPYIAERVTPRPEVYHGSNDYGPPARSVSPIPRPVISSNRSMGSGLAVPKVIGGRRGW